MSLLYRYQSKAGRLLKKKMLKERKGQLICTAVILFRIAQHVVCILAGRKGILNAWQFEVKCMEHVKTCRCPLTRNVIKSILLKSINQSKVSGITIVLCGLRKNEAEN